MAAGFRSGAVQARPRDSVIIARSLGRSKVGGQESRRICLTRGGGGTMLRESAHSVPAAEHVSGQPGWAPFAGPSLRRICAGRH